MAKYDITNPTLARRVIYDGLADQRRIVVEPGETKVGVELSEDVAAGYGDGSDGMRNDLLMTFSSESETLEYTPMMPDGEVVVSELVPKKRGMPPKAKVAA